MRTEWAGNVLERPCYHTWGWGDGRCVCGKEEVDDTGSVMKTAPRHEKRGAEGADSGYTADRPSYPPYAEVLAQLEAVYGPPLSPMVGMILGGWPWPSDGSCWLEAAG